MEVAAKGNLYTAVFTQLNKKSYKKKLKMNPNISCCIVLLVNRDDVCKNLNSHLIFNR